MIEQLASLFAPLTKAMSLFTIMIWTIFALAALLGVAGWRTGVKSASLAAILWLIYGVYELLMYARVLCSGDCNIRIDLLAIYPLLAIVTIIALINLLRRRLIRP